MSLADVGKMKQTTVVVLKHPDPAKKLKNPDGGAMTVTLHGPYSDRYRAVTRAQQQQRMTELEAVGDATLDQETLDAYTRELVVGCIESWCIWDTPDTELVFSSEAADALFDDHPWILDQLNRALGRTANFLDKPKSA